MEEKKMGKVVVKRGFSWEGLAGAFVVNIDDKEIGKIGHLKTETYDVPYGEHTIYISLPELKSKALSSAQSKFKSVKKTFVLTEDKPTVNVNCHVWAYGLLLITSFIKQEGYIEISID